MTSNLVLKGQTLSFRGDPFAVGPDEATRYERDGAVWIRDGHVAAVGPAPEVIAQADDTPVTDYGAGLICAGFVDCHVHYPQLPIIASYGEQLLEWLERYTFPCESAFSDHNHARHIADLFLDECVKNGTTTAAVYATVHPESVEAFFEASSAKGLRMACGKVLMDRNAPENLRDTAESGYEQSKQLIEKWHGKDRGVYAITPRFAPTSTAEQLRAAGELWREYPDTLVQTHISENTNEIEWVAELFPDQEDYLAVYEAFDLVGPGAIFGHGIHLTTRERAALLEAGAALAHCPTSNLFIGSGLFDMAGLRDTSTPITVGLATDVAGGSSLSMFTTMRAAYEVAQLRGHNLHPAKLWYMATIGSAQAMRLDDRIGNLAPGMEADVIVLDLASTPLIEARINEAEDIWDVLFAQMILADERAIRATYSGGQQVWERP